MLSHCKKRFLNLVFLLATLPGQGQLYYFSHYMVDEGIAHNNVITIMQDSKGLIWIGTKGGLNSFDGYRFKTYKYNNKNSGSGHNDIVLSINEDHNGILWFGTGQGLYKYDPFRDVFTQLPFHASHSISNIMVDKENNIWFLSNGTLCRYVQSQDKATELELRGNCAALDTAMNLWIGHQDGFVTKYSPREKTVSRIRIIGERTPVNSRHITRICQEPGGLLLIGTARQGLKSYDPVTGRISTLLQRNKDNTEIYVRDILPAGKDIYWIGTESGIFIYNNKTNQAQHLQKRPGDAYSLSDNAVYSLCKDNQGGFWVGTFFGGLNYFSSENARFEKYYPLQNANSISGSAVREICSGGKHEIWIGTEDAGVNRMDTRTGLFTHYSSQGRPGDISYPNIHGLLAVGDRLYIGPFFHGLEIMDTRTGRITDRFRTFGEDTHQQSDFVMCLYLTADSTLLVGTTGSHSGLFVYHPTTRQFTRNTYVPPDINVYSIMQDHEGTIWTGSVQRGAFYFNEKTGKNGNISFAEKVNGQPGRDYMVQGIYEDSDQAIWFATEGGGLIRLDASRRSFKKFTTENGFPSNHIFRMLEDNNKRLWISTLKGLICMDLRTGQYKVYTQSNGLLTDQFNYNAAFKDRNGKMYFGSVKGMIAFDPGAFNSKAHMPPTYITGFRINNREVTPNDTASPLKRSIIYTDSILLRHDQSSFNIEFAALNYASPKVTRYKYMMKGLDMDWTYLTSNRDAYFTDLSPGSYTFIVRAESNDGSWTGQERTLFIRILPPFWKSGLAYTLYFLAAAILLWLSIRTYHRYIEKRNLNRLRLFEHEKEKEIYQAKIEFFTNIAHEIQTPLTLITGPLEQIIKKIDELPSIRKSLLMMEKSSRRLLELTGQLLDFRKTEASQFGLNFVSADVVSILREQVSGFRQEAEKQHITLSADLPEEPLIAYIDIEAFTKICSNLLSNAIKYAAARAAVSMVTQAPDSTHFIIRFSNDGKMIPEEFREKIFEPFFRMRSNDKPGTGIGLSLARSLTELHNGSLRLVSGEADMILFELSLPLRQKFEFKLGKWKNLQKNDG